ncbi:MAG TPA: aldo/keto reductase [Polyangiaceae bacterium]|nr:aldo/keto reductase [Polyangiaceae bacterium]
MNRTLNGREVGPVGLGCMGMTWAYGAGDADRAEHLAVIRRALELGANLIDTADIYGPHTNEELVGEALAGGRRARAFLATKAGLVNQGGGPFDIKVNGRPEHIRAAIDASLRRLGVEAVDLWQLHRVDPEVPLEETWGAMAEAVRAGKAKAIGLSEATVEQLERARSVHPVASVQSELSLWTRDHLPVVRRCEELGVAFLAYSPLGRGFLAGRIADRDALAEDDWRRKNPRFQAEALRKNARITEVVARVAERRGHTPAQVALAWALAQSPVVIPIPGTRRVSRLEENVAAARVALAREDVDELDALPPAEGSRY